MTHRKRSLLVLLWIVPCATFAYAGTTGSCSLAEFGNSTHAMRNAVAECHRRFPSGARLIVPSGIWPTAAFNLTSNFELFLDSGAILVGVGRSDDRKALLEDFPLVPPLPSYGFVRDTNGWPGMAGSNASQRCKGVDQSRVLRHTPWIGGWNLSNVSVVGAGVEFSTLDGGGHTWWESFLNGCLEFGRPRMLELLFSQNIELRNFSIRNSPFWTVHMYASDTVHIANLDIRNPNHAVQTGSHGYSIAPNADGIDADSTTNMLVEDVHVAAGDDAIAIKSGMNEYGRAFGRPSANVTIRNSILVGRGVAVGSEMSGGVYNVTFENLLLPGAHIDPGMLGGPTWGGLQIKAGPPRGGEVKGIVYRNITVGAYKGAPFTITMQPYDEFSGNVTPTSATRVSDILLEDVRSNVVGSALFHGYSKAWPLRNVTLRRVHLAEQQQWQCIHVEGVTSEDVFPPLPTTCQAADLKLQQRRERWIV